MSRYFMKIAAKCDLFAVLHLTTSSPGIQMLNYLNAHCLASVANVSLNFLPVIKALDISQIVLKVVFSTFLFREKV